MKFCEFSHGYCLKSKNSLKRDDARYIVQALFIFVSAKFRKSQSQSINDA